MRNRNIIKFPTHKYNYTPDTRGWITPTEEEITPSLSEFVLTEFEVPSKKNSMEKPINNSRKRTFEPSLKVVEENKPKFKISNTIHKTTLKFPCKEHKF